MVVADKLDEHSAYNHLNYWSPLACLVDEQETEENSHPPQIERIAAMSTTAPSCPQNKIAAKWERNFSNHQTGIMDMGATSGLGEHRPTLHQSIQDPRQIKDQSNPKDAPEAKTTGRGKRNECSPRTALHTRQHPQNGQCRLHGSIQQTQGHHL